MASALPFAPIRWSNQVLTVYHGTIQRNVASICSGVDVALGRTSADFGRGFYATTIERQARTWAWELSKRARGPGNQPAIIRFEIERDRLASLECLWFIRGNFDAEDFWSFVFHCRSGGMAHDRSVNQGWFDVVAGPVAASWRQRLPIYDADQFSFHTSRAAALLNNSRRTEIP